MRILVPMAGEGKRFVEKGYKTSKPVILTYDRRTGHKIPMVVCAVKDLPGVEEGGKNVIFVDREFHVTDGSEAMIKEYFPKAEFIHVNKLTEGQACTCLLAKDSLDLDESLLIAGCDNGMDYSADKFYELTTCADELVFTYRHNEAVLVNPAAYGWMKVDCEDKIIGASIKKAISNTPLEDHAVVATFWFKTAKLFVDAAERMILLDDRVNGEFYVDEVVTHVLRMGYLARVFEIDRYIGWGTPYDYENYQNTYEYWRNFLRCIGCL